MNKDLYYLAAPHMGTVEEESFRVATCLKTTAAFLIVGIPVFSPIVYSIEIAKALEIDDLEKRRAVVLDYLLSFLKVSKGMILLTLEGWKKSYGVNAEIMFCKEHNIPIYVMHPEQVSGDLSSIVETPIDAHQLDQILEELEDIELAKLIESRAHEKWIEVDIDDL